MKKIFFKKILVSLVLIAVLGIISAGCGGTTTTIIPTPTPTPIPCTLTIYSQGFWCYGYVWINGASTGEWIDTNGAVTITGLIAGTAANVQIVDNFGWDSVVKSIVLQPGQNIMTFTFLDCP